MEHSTGTEGWQANTIHADETKMESPTFSVSTKDKLTYIGEAESPEDRACESRLLDRAEYILRYCGLIQGSPELKTTLDQVRRRLRRQSEFI